MRAAAIAGRKLRLPKLGIGPQVIIVILILGLLGAMAIEPTRELIAQRDRIQGMSKDLAKLEASNDRLETRIAHLRDPDFLEERAREQIGLVRPGEVAYVVMPPNKSSESAPAKKEPAVPKQASGGVLSGFLSFIGLR